MLIISPKVSCVTMTQQIDTARRRLIQQGAALSLGSLFLPNVLAKGHDPERKVSLYNVHTGESVNATYWAEGQYINEELQRVYHLLRDFRQDQSVKMDVALIEALNRIHTMTGSKQSFQVVSGYRSPKTNEMLRRRGHRVAKNSYHLRGQAIDFRLPDVQLSKAKKAAVSLKAGGVGYYPRSNFIHVDTGRVRYW